MAWSHQLSLTGAVLLCLASTHANSVLIASEEPRLLQDAASPSSSGAAEAQAPAQAETPRPSSVDDRHITTPRLSIAPSPRTEWAPSLAESLGATRTPWPDPQAGDRSFKFLAPSVFAGQVYQGRPYPMYHDHGRSIVALTVGAIAAITGTAVLVYANRPECDIHHYAGGCGYGTKVIGGAVLAGGLVGVTVGALTW